MSVSLNEMFSWLCGQFPAHTWAADGLPLPCCQRCTGLYLGALAAFVLQTTLRPCLTPRFLWVNGAFLALMIPFGFYWVPQGPLLRCWSGVLFGFGLVTFLSLTTLKRPEVRGPNMWRLLFYWAGFGMTLAATGVVSRGIGSETLPLTSLLLFCGAATLLMLVLANAWTLASALLQKRLNIRAAIE